MLLLVERVVAAVVRVAELSILRVAVLDACISLLVKREVAFVERVAVAVDLVAVVRSVPVARDVVAVVLVVAIPPLRWISAEERVTLLFSDTVRAERTLLVERISRAFVIDALRRLNDFSGLTVA